MSDDARLELERIHDAHVDAVNSCDLELLLRDFSDDIVYIAPGMEPLVGKDALRSYIAPIYERASIAIDMDAQEYSIVDDHGVERGRASGIVAMDGVESVVALHYLLVYRREADGAWRVTHNISTPAPTMG